MASGQGSDESRIVEFVVLEGTLVPKPSWCRTEPIADVAVGPSILSLRSLLRLGLSSSYRSRAHSAYVASQI